MFRSDGVIVARGKLTTLAFYTRQVTWLSDIVKVMEYVEKGRLNFTYCGRCKQYHV